MKKLALIGAVSLALLPAQASADHIKSLKLDHSAVTAKTWLSTGGTSWNHTAGDPDLGDPTSVLDYESLDALIFELTGRVQMQNDWFLRGQIGVGEITEGTLRDRDYFSPQAASDLGGPEKFSDTDSKIEEDDVFYAGVDVGFNVWKNRSARADFYVGYQYWREDVTATGVIVTADPYNIYGGTGALVNKGIDAISNRVEWESFRIGLDTKWMLSKRWELQVDAALIPYSRMHNEDIHHLRSDLAQGPSISMDGDGYGAQIDASLVYYVTHRLNVHAGARYWHMKSDGDITFHAANGGSSKAKLNALDSDRYGLTAGLSYAF